LTGLIGRRSRAHKVRWALNPTAPAAGTRTRLHRWPAGRIALASLHQLHRRLARTSPSPHQASTAALAITDEASPFALRSTRNRPRRAVRPGCGLAGTATKQLAGRVGGRLALAGGPPPSRHGRQAPQAPSTGTRRNTMGYSPARARWAWWLKRCGGRPCLRQRASVLGQRPESSVRCGCPAARVPVHAAAVRCPVRASERPDVRCPAWVSGVRGFPRPLCPAGRWWRVALGQAAAWLGWPGSAWSPAVSRG
jgi:hypothetical protein